MSVLWNLSLRAKSADETAKINEYAKELNQKYNFELYTEEYGGLKFCDWGFRYEDIDSDKVKPAKEMIKEVVAHFRENKTTSKRDRRRDAMAALGDWRQLEITYDKEGKYFTDATQTVE